MCECKCRLVVAVPPMHTVEAKPAAFESLLNNEAETTLDMLYDLDVLPSSKTYICPAGCNSDSKHAQIHHTTPSPGTYTLEV